MRKGSGKSRKLKIELDAEENSEVKRLETDRKLELENEDVRKLEVENEDVRKTKLDVRKLEKKKEKLQTLCINLL